MSQKWFHDVSRGIYRKHQEAPTCTILYLCLTKKVTGFLYLFPFTVKWNYDILYIYIYIYIHIYIDIYMI